MIASFAIWFCGVSLCDLQMCAMLRRLPHCPRRAEAGGQKLFFPLPTSINGYYFSFFFILYLVISVLFGPSCALHTTASCMVSGDLKTTN